MIQNKRIILFSYNLNAAGGAERLLHEHAISLRKIGYEVFILSFNYHDSSLFNQTYSNANIIQINPKYKDKKYITNIDRIYRLRKKIDEIKPDIIVGQHYIDCETLYFATLFTPYRYVSFIHGTFMWFVGDILKYSMLFKKNALVLRDKIAGHKVFSKKIYKYRHYKEYIRNQFDSVVNYLSVKKALAIISLTPTMANEAQILYKREVHVEKGAYPSNIFNHTLKYDIKKEINIYDKKIILNINRLDKRKRIDLLINSFYEYYKTDENAVLVIGGTGDEEQNLKELVSKLNLNSNVVFLGFVEEKKLLDYYATCDIFVHPNWAEYVISVYEALAMGAKVVCTYEMDFDDELLKYNQIFLANPTVQSLTTQINEALCSKENNIPQNVLEKYTWDNYFDKINQIIKENL